LVAWLTESPAFGTLLLLKFPTLNVMSTFCVVPYVFGLSFAEIISATWHLVPELVDVFSVDRLSVSRATLPVFCAEALNGFPHHCVESTFRKARILSFLVHVARVLSFFFCWYTTCDLATLSNVAQTWNTKGRTHPATASCPGQGRI
jgi:hypothetical protein